MSANQGNESASKFRVGRRSCTNLPRIVITGSADQVRLQQQLVDEKVNRIWTVLSAFEESAAACISDMLLHVSNQSYIEAVNEAGNFIMHVEKLFEGIDELERESAKYKDNIGECSRNHGTDLPH